jgi:site-specific DNA recombinase
MREQLTFSPAKTKVFLVAPSLRFMKNEEIKYFKYIRKSSESEGRQVLSIPGQLENTETTEKREHLTSIETIIDARSAMKPYNRPKFTDMIKRIEKGEASGIILWTIDRLARNSIEWGIIMYLLQIGVIKSIWTTEREYLPKDSILLLALQSSMATQYSIDLSQKVRNGQDQKAKLGRPNGLAKLGYQNTKRAIHGTNTVVVDPKRWHIMRKGFDMMLARAYSVSQIADILNNEYGLRSRLTKKTGGRPIHKSILYRVFTDPFYYGYFHFKGVLYKGSYKPMITVEEFDQIQEILGRKGKPRQQKHTFPFTGFIKCGVCGCAITATQVIKRIKTTGITKTYVFYHCTKRKGRDVCTEKHYTKKEELEKMIEAELSEYMIDENFKNLALEILEGDKQEAIEKQKKLYEEVVTHEQKLIKETDTLLDLRISNLITEEKFIAKQLEKDNELIRVKAKIESFDVGGLRNRLSKVSDALDFSVLLVKRFKKAPAEVQKSICKSFGHNWVLKDKKLIIDKPKWFLSIKKFKDVVSSDLDPSQPFLTYEKYRLKSSFSASILALRSLRDEVTTNALNSGHKGS